MYVRTSTERKLKNHRAISQACRADEKKMTKKKDEALHSN